MGNIRPAAITKLERQLWSTLFSIARKEIGVIEAVSKLGEDLSWVLDPSSEIVAYKDWFRPGMYCLPPLYII
jgi:hypothetical protein